MLQAMLHCCGCCNMAQQASATIQPQQNIDGKLWANPSLRIFFMWILGCASVLIPDIC